MSTHNAAAFASHNSGLQIGQLGSHNTVHFNSYPSQGVQAAAAHDEPKGNVHWNITRSTNTFFTGRRDILDELQKIVQQAVADPMPSDQCRIVISGMGGQGKSELALQLANRVRDL
jgi:Mrp family chromosome partitioning ATPase